eukprot:jgi/Chlat1/475/Chrsp103S01074
MIGSPRQLQKSPHAVSPTASNAGPSRCPCIASAPTQQQSPARETAVREPATCVSTADGAATPARDCAEAALPDRTFGVDDDGSGNLRFVNTSHHSACVVIESDDDDDTTVVRSDDSGGMRSGDPCEPCQLELELNEQLEREDEDVNQGFTSRDSPASTQQQAKRQPDDNLPKLATFLTSPSCEAAHTHPIPEPSCVEVLHSQSPPPHIGVTDACHTCTRAQPCPQDVDDDRASVGSPVPSPSASLSMMRCESRGDMSMPTMLKNDKGECVDGGCVEPLECRPLEFSCSRAAAREGGGDEGLIEATTPQSENTERHNSVQGRRTSSSSAHPQHTLVQALAGSPTEQLQQVCETPASCASTPRVVTSSDTLSSASSTRKEEEDEEECPNLTVDLPGQSEMCCHQASGSHEQKSPPSAVSPASSHASVDRRTRSSTPCVATSYGATTPVITHIVATPGAESDDGSSEDCLRFATTSRRTARVVIESDTDDDIDGDVVDESGDGSCAGDGGACEPCKLELRLVGGEPEREGEGVDDQDSVDDGDVIPASIQTHARMHSEHDSGQEGESTSSPPSPSSDELTQPEPNSSPVSIKAQPALASSQISPPVCTPAPKSGSCSRRHVVGRCVHYSVDSSSSSNDNGGVRFTRGTTRRTAARVVVSSDDDEDHQDGEDNKEDASCVINGSFSSPQPVRQLAFELGGERDQTELGVTKQQGSPVPEPRTPSVQKKDNNSAHAVYEWCSSDDDSNINNMPLHQQAGARTVLKPIPHHLPRSVLPRHRSQPRTSVITTSSGLSKREFVARREGLAAELLAEFNARVFGGRLPCGLEVRWNKGMQTTAGVTRLQRRSKVRE